MPPRIGHGRRNLRVNKSASSWVLSPISAIATRPVEMKKAWSENIWAGDRKVAGRTERASARQAVVQPGPGRRAKGLARSRDADQQSLDRSGHGAAKRGCQVC